MSGSGGGGGYEYQAKATAYVAAHILACSCLKWIEHENPDVPVAVAEETGGAGDDLHIVLDDSTEVELQAKHGLKKNDKFWQAILKLGQGLKDNEKLYGVLLTDSTASKVLREDLRCDLKRIGQGRTDGLKRITEELQQKFAAADLPTESPDLFRRLRIVVVDLDDDLPDGKQAYLLLKEFLHDNSQSSITWSTLCQEGQYLLSNRGRRDSTEWARLLSSKGIQMKSIYAQKNGTRTVEENKYLKKINNKYQNWWDKSFQFLQQMPRSDSLPWHNFDLDVEIPIPREEQQSSSDIQSKIKKLIPILEIIQIARQEPMLIFGKPGAGKSTFLSQSMRKLAEAAIDDPDAPIPVLIKIQSHMSQLEVQSLILTSFKTEGFLLGMSEADNLIYLENLIKNHRLFLLIDIVNELPQELIEDLKQFCERDIPIILAMRDAGTGSLGIRKKCEIQSLNRNVVKTFFKERLSRQDQNYVQGLCERVNDFGQTPLMVWMLYIIFIKMPGSSPKTRGAAYRSFTTIYIEETKNGVDLERSKQILAKIAFRMIDSNEPLLESEIRAEFGPESFQGLLANHLLYWTGDPGSREVSFCHPSLQEYYAVEDLMGDRQRPFRMAFNLT